MSTEPAEIIDQFARGDWLAAAGAHPRAAGALVGPADSEEFARVAAGAVAAAGPGEVLGRALGLTLQSAGARLELSFIGYFAALESVLTYFRRQGDYEIMPAEEFARLGRDMKVWLKGHPLLAGDAARRGLIYEKARELNRYPFSHVFARFCDARSLDLSDLWPLHGRADEWPLIEVRHRLVHGDPFRSRPAEAVECARAHLAWTTARVILSALGWPVGRSLVSPTELAHAGGTYENWRAERAKLS